MKRLSNYEKTVLALSVIVTAGGLAGILVWTPRVVFSAFLILIFLLGVLVALCLLRLERAATQQKRTREEIYQVLYTLHGNDQLTEHQARKTRDHVLRQHDVLREELVRMRNTAKNKSSQDFESSADALGTGAIRELAEDQRLRFNNLVSILDTHWEVMDEQRTAPNDSTYPGSS